MLAMPAVSLPVRYFRPRVDGPEQRIEDAVIESLSGIFNRNDWPQWVGSYVPIGAGLPDVVSVWYDPQVITLAGFESEDGHILAYLRSVRRATSAKIAERLQYKTSVVASRIARLEGSAVVARESQNSFVMLPAWRRILPEVVTIEAKVANWQSALQQAIRNRIFAHRSYVALPETVAQRVTDAPAFALHGVGVIAVGERGEVWVHREARKAQPSVWNYYFHLAAVAAKDLTNRNT